MAAPGPGRQGSCPRGGAREGPGPRRRRRERTRRAPRLGPRPARPRRGAPVTPRRPRARPPAAGRGGRAAAGDPRGAAARAAPGCRASWSTSPIGVLLGESGLGIRFDDAEVAHALGFAALVLILAEGGLTTPWPEIRPVMRLGRLAGHRRGRGERAGGRWSVTTLLGARPGELAVAAGRGDRAHRRRGGVLRAPPAAVCHARLTGALEAESGLNDAPTVVLVTLVSAGSAGGGHGVLGFAFEIVYELALGVLGGAVVGFGGAWLLRRSALPASGLYPLAVLSFTVLAYAGDGDPPRLRLRRVEEVATHERLVQVELGTDLLHPGRVGVVVAPEDRPHRVAQSRGGEVDQDRDQPQGQDRQPEPPCHPPGPGECRGPGLWSSLLARIRLRLGWRGRDRSHRIRPRRTGTCRSPAAGRRSA